MVGAKVLLGKTFVLGDVSTAGPRREARSSVRPEPSKSEREIDSAA